MMRQVFISHSVTDRQAAETICESLEAQGLSCWIAPRDIPPGAEWPIAIMEGIAEAGVVLLVHSAASSGSQMVRREVNVAVDSRKSIIPVRIDPTVPHESIQFYLGTTHWLDVCAGPLQIHLPRIAAAVSERLGLDPGARPRVLMTPPAAVPLALPDKPSVAMLPEPEPEPLEPPTRAMPARRARTKAVFAGAVVLAAILGAGGWWIFRERTSPPATALSVVVLPFANLSNDPNQGYFVDAITDDLTTDLSRISGSVVIAHSTAQTFKDRPLDLKTIGHDLDVRYALEGSVREMGDQVEVNVQLIDTESGTHVWADRFETDRSDLARAQSEITGRLANTLGVQLAEAAGHQIEQQNRTDPDARDLAMRGWDLWYRPFSVANRQEAARVFTRALEIDPRSVDAEVGLATILVSNAGTGLSQDPKGDIARAEPLLLKAIEQDANSSHAHQALGTLRRIQNRLEEARVEYKTAVELNHNNAEAMLGLGQTLMFLGRPKDAIPEVENAIRLDPRDPNIAFGHWTLGACHLLLGHMDQATDLLRQARAENPRVYFFLLYLAGALGLHGDIEEARAALADAIRLNPQVNSLARWVAAQPWIGNPAFAALRGKTVDAGLRLAGMPAE